MDRLWCDKHRPKSLDHIDYNHKLAGMLRKLALAEDLPHLLIYGPNGAGKKTRIMSFLSELYGNGVYKVKVDPWECKTSATSSTKIELSILSSNYHLDITPSDVEIYDRVVLQKLIKEVASATQIDVKTQKSFKIVIINEADRLTREAQASLRRTMEKYVHACRFVMVCENLGRIIQPLRSRCLLLRVPAPANNDIQSILLKIAKKESIQLNEKLALRIAEDSGRNLRRAIMQLQTLKMQKYPFNDAMPLHIPEWRQGIKSIVEDILSEHSPKQIKLIREKVYDLLINGIPGDMIIKCMLIDLLKHVLVDTKFEIIHWAAFHERRMQLGSKPIFHIEAFVARNMVIMKRQIQAEMMM